MSEHKKRKNCIAKSPRAPVVRKVAVRTDVSKKRETARVMLESAEWFEKYMPESERIKSGSVWEMMHNLDKDLDVPDFFDKYQNDCEKFMSIAERIRVLFIKDDHDGECLDEAGCEDAAFEVLKFIPTTPEITAIFTELYRNWCAEGCQCKKNHFATMVGMQPDFWKLIEQDERIVKWYGVLTEKK